MIRFNFPLAVDFVVTRMINEEQQDEVFVAVHEGYMSINRFGNFTIFPISMGKSSSLIMISNLACTTPAHTTHILCVNVIKGTQKICKDDIPPGSHGYSDVCPRLQLVYIVTSDQKTIFKFNVSDDCLVLISKKSGNDYGSVMWFSYNNGSTLFLSNGLALNAVELEAAGTLGGEDVGTVRYSSLSQLYSQASQLGGSRKLLTWPIMTIQNDVMNKVFYFKWSDLSSNGTETIPSPNGYSIVRPISLQYCQMDFAYALVTYKREKDNSLRTGVAYIKSYF
ncbi:uncharacterized protein LOC135331643 [Halichondria panicea]|uniref:uncharacterized protein LOC135331643 n=1 Tax=Halichondria panicea TaxID=6063 RepID=UPI00312B33BA